MDMNCPVTSSTTANGEFYGSIHSGNSSSRRHPQWLLELDTDGTIRHSSSQPSQLNGDGRQSLIGSNFFDLSPVLGDLSDLKRNFFGFVRSGKNRETSYMPLNGESMIVLTRSCDNSWDGRREVVLMEIRSE